MIIGRLRLGFIPLADCAPLAVAEALGLFRAEGLDVELVREASWATIRDKVQARLLDGAHMLGPMALASSLGIGGERSDMLAPMALNLNGSAVSVSRGLMLEMRAADPEAMAQRPRTARALKCVIDHRRMAGQPPLTFAVVFPFSMHAYELRYWLAEAGIDPDRDLRLVVSPPPRMAERLKSGEIEGFCVGAPWNAAAEAEGSGEIVVRASEIWPAGPDKVLGVARAFAEKDPETLQALLRALIRAARWADQPENRPALSEVLARPQYVGQPPELLARALVESRDAIVFHAGEANFPWLSHAAWFLAQMRRWGQAGPEIDIAKAAAAVYRPDLYRKAAEAVGAPTPPVDSKVEGAFDPGDIEGYLGSFAVRREPAGTG
jgi:ABC-type nitrate/sulfonate/bicarbonate transport system substrate-binding protein